jgi:pimeloyl-ACP methyl ester carboxylesterase
MQLLSMINIMHTSSRKIEYIVKGTSDRNIILFPGANNSFHTYRKVIDLLSQDFTVYCPNYPGFGKTTKPKTHTLLEYVNFASEFINELNLEKYSIMGVSFGTYLTAELLTVRPHLQKQIDLLIWGSPMIKLRTYRIIGMISRYAQHEWQSRTVKEKNLLPSILAPENLHAPIQQFRHTKMILELAPNPELFDAITSKILVVVGDKDRVVDSGFTINLFSDNTNITMKRYAHLGHDTFAQIGNELNKSMLEALS